MPDQLVNLDMKHGVEAKNYEEVHLIPSLWGGMKSIKTTANDSS